jgi:predicted RNase H-like HicB family nuclease
LSIEREVHMSCYTQLTQEEALKEALKAKEAWLETARSRNKPIPRPQYRPAIYQVA